MNCYLHPDKPASGALNVPCAPGGKIHVCADCAADPEITEKTWEKYKSEHKKRIVAFKGVANPEEN